MSQAEIILRVGKDSEGFRPEVEGDESGSNDDVTTRPFPPKLKALVCDCWQPKPKNRPTFVDVLERLKAEDLFS